MEELGLCTKHREELADITPLLRDMVRRKGWQDGALLVFSPHTTAGLTVNEAADPDVRTDIAGFMNSQVPRSPAFCHAEGNSDAHIKTSLFSPHVLLILDKGALRLGTWQGVYFVEWDGPRSRRVWVQYLAAGGGPSARI